MTNLWPRLDQLIAAAPDPAVTDLEAHGVHLIAARCWRACGRPVPPALRAAERAAALGELAAPALLTRVRSTLDGPIMLLKGPEIAARYPDPALRAYGDLDLLVPDAAAAQAALLEAGFELVDDYAFTHQLQPLRWPGLPLLIEMHHHPSWLRWMTPPPNDDLFARAVPSATGLAGILTLPPAEHALLLAAHSWRHVPLRRLIDLVDVAVMANGIAPEVLATLARRWGLGPVWTTTTRAIDGLFGERPTSSWPLRLWARHLRGVRDRTVIEKHLVFWLGALWAPTPRTKLLSVATTLSDDIRPMGGEPWPAKLTRTGRAVHDAFTPWSRRERTGPRQNQP